ncbi:hypothetical protein [Thermodesulforhabdus norvegica]|uniref:Uncharacterized protein n=1 Tax=Thermodesulforhabdus norvegica TaxID=39841 RepID=A0A1I4TBP9_9BACT|nr:hypothetical protein [Thermodesulforhabdus norvegica]SFM74106.1 hypothetical protein SAMN05660836_01330 [Thermodesulforhabdus norvegica]
MTYSDEIWRLVEPDLGKISEGLSFLGIKLWKPGMFFMGAPDSVLKKITGSFPAKKRSAGSSHPIFVLEVYPAETYHRVCPCTSKYVSGARYIRAGCVLEHTSKLMARTSFLLEKFAFSLPFSAKWIGQLRYMGTVPEECVKQGV